MNISHINFLGFIGGFAPLPPRRRGTKAAVDEYPLYATKKSEAVSITRQTRDISERFLLGGVPVVAPPAHFFRAFGEMKREKRTSANLPVRLPVKPIYTEARP